MAGKMRKDILITISLFSVAFLVRVVGVSNVCMYSDELFYWMQANNILTNNFAPTAEMFEGAIPFLSYIGAVVTVLFDGKLNTLRMISVIFGSLTVPMLYLFGTAMYDRKTGLLAALFLCFSAYHCLYSRIFLLEALTLFFITAFLYFFWVSQRSEGRKSTTYACLAGAMLGLAIDAKYISLFLIPAIIAYILWIKRFDFKALLDKHIFLIFVFAFLFSSLLLICLYVTGVGLHPIYYYAVEKFGMGEEYSVNIRVASFSPSELLVRGGQSMLALLAWDSGLLIPSWTELFFIAVIFLFLITLFYHLHNFINRERRSSFLMISIFILGIILLGSARVLYYLIYLLPFYFVMLSHLAVKSFKHLRKENSCKNIFRIFIILLTAIMLFSYFVIGVTSPYCGESEYSWTKSAVEHIKGDIVKSGYNEHIVIGIVLLSKEPIEYHMYKPMEYQTHFSNSNASTISCLKPAGTHALKKRTLSLDRIDILKPNYLIVNKLEYEYYFKESIKRKILNDYNILFYSPNYFIEKYRIDIHMKGMPYLIFKRKDMQPPELSPLTDGKGKISQDMFERSVPGVMKIGEVYTSLVQVKNTEDSRTTFIVWGHSDRYTIFVDDELRSITLDKGSTRILKFKIVPIKEYAGELPVTVDLYARDEENETYEKVNSVSDCIYLIKK